LHFRSDDSPDLAENILAVLGDAKLAERLSQSGLETVVEHDLQKRLIMFERLYENLL